MDSETFGIEAGNAGVIEWLNDTAKREGGRFEARSYGYAIDTRNFGPFEMFSWMGDVKRARKLIIRAGKRFRIRTIEGGYKTKEMTFDMKRTDYAKVRKGDRVIGYLTFKASRFGRDRWELAGEERA